MIYYRISSDTLFSEAYFLRRDIFNGTTIDTVQVPYQFDINNDTVVT